MAATDPTPGSPDALARGCKCPVVDNAYGRGAYIVNGDPKFWTSAACSLHAVPLSPEPADSETGDLFGGTAA